MIQDVGLPGVSFTYCNQRIVGPPPWASGRCRTVWVSTSSGSGRPSAPVLAGLGDSTGTLARSRAGPRLGRRSDASPQLPL